MNRIIQSNSSLKDESGMALLIVALSMFMLIGFIALVVDIGGLYVEKSRLQKAIDSAVLGGAQLIKDSESDAIQVAIDLALKNGFTVNEDEITTGDNYIEIQKTVTKELTFARVLGIQNTVVSAFARAEIQGALVKGNGVIPVGLENTTYQKGALYPLNAKPGQGTKGNYNYLAIDGRGANVLGQAIANGTKKTVVVGEEVETEPGQNWGKVEAGFSYRIEEDQKNNPNCSTYEKADASCKRVVILPLIDTYDHVNGRSDVLVVGFAAYWIESVNKHEITGRFIEIIKSGTFSPGEDFGIYGVKLVK
ncbi:pilus assembly protein TadG-related protein [Paenisporosarcina sp. NPDC076898]|uniref:pilus assembly protein TadG-related protein n=1 Tax=unclassified Paenisporosarcina TaxID=2642018 RepID=UPI003D035EAD